MTQIDALVDPLFAASHPDVMGRNAYEATLPIAFLNDVNTATTREEILAVYAKWTKRIVGSESCSVSLLNDDDILELISFSGTVTVHDNSNRGLDDSAAGAVFKRREGLFVPKIGDMPHSVAKQAHENGFRCAYLAPVHAGQNCYGVLTATFRVESARPSLVLTLIEAMANCMGTQFMVMDQLALLEDMALTDPLTGTRNRRALYEATPQSWADWKTDRVPFAYLTLDIDRFKCINDTHGHAVGDAILQQLAQRVLTSSRADDIVFRLGGEEFGVLLPNTLPSLALRIAKRMHDVIRSAPFIVDKLSLDVTASVGVTEIAPDDVSPNDVINRADDALYHAKRSGRDRVVQAAPNQVFLN